MTLTEQVCQLYERGWDKARIARELGVTRSKVRRILARVQPVREGVKVASEALDAITRRFSGDAQDVEVKVPRLIRTEAEALAASEIDLSVWEPVRVEVRHYPLPTAGGVEQGSYVKVACKRRTLLTDPARIVAAVEAGVEQAITRRVMPAAVPRFTRQSVLRTRIITDLHIGGYAWEKSTGGDNWDIHTALETALASNRYLDTQAPDDASSSLLAFMGDLCHYDTPKGTTTGGTQLDLDSRVDMMLKAVSEYAVTTVAEEAERRPTTVLLVEGNHDQILSKALRRMLLLVFAKHKNVTVLEQYTKRQYHRFGDTLLGFTHGDGNAQRIVDAMAHECGKLRIWDGAKCRELHKGHLHHESAKQRVLSNADTLQGVVVRTHVALTPTDQYHHDEAWVGSTRGMSDYYYHHHGALIGTSVAVPHLLRVA